MLSFNLVSNPAGREGLLLAAETIEKQLEERRHLAGGENFENVHILFDPEHDYHHFLAHCSRNYSLLPKDLLFVSHYYLTQLETFYDIVLLRRINQHISQNVNPTSEDCLKILKKNESLLFLMHAAAILSCHINKGKETYCPFVTKDITNKYIDSMINIGYAKQDARKLLGNMSPYRDRLKGEEFRAFDRTSQHLNETTRYDTKNGTINTYLCIPAISPEGYEDWHTISTLDFTEDVPPQSAWYPIVKQTLEYLQTYDTSIFPGERILENFLIRLLESQPKDLLQSLIEKFLLARKDIENEFWQRYRGAYCCLSEH